jgi:hypothetical protein
VHPALPDPAALLSPRLNGWRSQGLSQTDQQDVHKGILI